MRYIYMLTAAIVILTIVIAVAIMRIEANDSGSEKIALKINGKSYSVNELQLLMQEKPHDMSDDQFKRVLIEKELLIQEAMRMNLHEQKDFKKNIKNYYEQSLISALLNRKSSEVKVTADKKEIERFISRMGSKLEIATLYYRDSDSALKKTGQTKEHKEIIPFDDLSDNYKYRLSMIDKGECTPPIQDEYGYRVLMLINVSGADTPSIDNTQIKTIVEKIIVAEKRKIMMENWQQDLFAKSTIEYNYPK